MSVERRRLAAARLAGDAGAGRRSDPKLPWTARQQWPYFKFQVPGIRALEPAGVGLQANVSDFGVGDSVRTPRHGLAFAGSLCLAGVATTLTGYLAPSARSPPHKW